MNKIIIFILALFVTFSTASTYDNERIAISADGNSAPDFKHKWATGDPDDWGGTPAALAIIAKLKLQDNLVHYSYNNFIEAPSGPDEKNQMKISVDGAVSRWAFDKDIFFDVTRQLKSAKEHLKNELIKSTADDPLFFIHMGPAEFFYQVVKDAVDAGHAGALSHVYIISHSGYNDNHLRRDYHHTIKDAIEYSGNRLNYEKIKDQNGKWDPNLLWNSEKDFSPWYWMRDHRGPNVRWLYSRAKAHSGGKADISDAGMVYYLLLGDPDGSPAKFKKFIGDGIPSDHKRGPKAMVIPKDGKLVTIETESMVLKGKWEKVEADRVSGGAYIQYTGPNHYNAVDSNQTIEMRFKVDSPGTYTVKWLMRQPTDAEGDKSNDVWINFPDAVQIGGGRELKGFHKFVGRSKTVFGFNGQLDLHGKQPWMNVSFSKKGNYTIQLSGRSEFLQIDKFVLYKNMTFDQAQFAISNGK